MQAAHGTLRPSESWLEDFLRDGPKTIAEIRAAAAEAGYAWSTISTARTNLDIHSVKHGVWALPSEEDAF